MDEIYKIMSPSTIVPPTVASTEKKLATLDDVVQRLDRLIELQEAMAYNIDTYMMWWRNR